MPIMGTAEPKRVIGGYENEVEPAGDGSSSVTMQTIVPPRLSGLKLLIDDARGDLQYLQDLADKGEMFDFSYDRVDLSTWGCRMQIVGSIEFDEKTSTVELELKGVGKLEPV